MSAFSEVDYGPTIEPFKLIKEYAEDTFEKKVNLGVGAYRTEEDGPWVLPVVRRAEREIAADDALDKEYTPVLGLEYFTKAATELLLGRDSPAISSGKAFGIQALAGTGALRVAAEFLKTSLGCDSVYYSTPSWDNHSLLFENAGYKHLKTYRYWCPAGRTLDFGGMLEDVGGAPPKSAIVLQMSAHNPTGCDPTKEQWKLIADVLEERRLYPVIDAAYHGFASGDLDEDAWLPRYFVSRGLEFVCAQSFSKNFGLYCERIGNLVFVVNDAAVVPRIKSKVTVTIRGMYSSPTSHSARIVGNILTNPELKKKWEDSVRVMGSRIRAMRKLLREALESLGTPGNWDHITSQIGMFSYSGLNEKQSERMTEHHHVYMFRSGRMCMCGLNKNNIQYVAEAMHDVVTDPSLQK